MRRLLCLALLAVAACASAQRTIVIPHVLEVNGSVMGIFSSVGGGQDPAGPYQSRRGYDYYKALALEMYPAGNDALLKMVVNDMMDPTTLGSDWDITRYDGETARKRTFSDALITEVGLPVLEQGSSSTNPLYVGGTYGGTNPIFQSTNNQRPKQKKWLSCNFRLKLGDLPCSRINKIESFTIKQAFEDLDGDGKVDEFTDMSEVAFDVPWADAAPFMEWFQMQKDGKGVALPFELDVYDGSSFVIGVRAELVVSALGPADPFGLDLLSGSPTMKIKGRPHELKGHVTLIK